jgi:glycosyltransferase involved in cell wall biosynthesis
MNNVSKSQNEVASDLRILLISQGFPKYVGDSTAPFMAPIAAGLVARGHSVDVVLPHHPEFRYPEEDRLRFEPYRYSPTDRLSPWGFGGSLTGTSRVSVQAAMFLPLVAASLHRRVSKLLSAHTYDVVHAHWLVPNAWLASGPATKHRVPLVVTLHGSDVAIAERTKLLRWIARRTLATSGAVTAVSNDLALRVEKLGADPRTLSTVHLGVDTETFAPRDVGPEIRARLGAPTNALLVIAVGRLVEKKGFRYLIEAAGRVEGIHLAIIGDGGLRAPLEAIARSSNASTTFTGNLDQSAVSDAVAAADIVAVPSVWDAAGNVDGLPTTLLEALSAGRPVIASAIAGIPEVVTDGGNGLLVPEKDVDSLVRALTKLRDQPQLRDELGRNARRRALTELDWDATARAFEEAYVTAGARPAT